MAVAALPDTFNLTLYRGDDYKIVFLYGRRTPEGVSQITSTTGWNARAQIRKDWGKDLWVDLTVGDGLTLALVEGDLAIYMHIRSTATEGPEWNNRDWGVWDLELTDPAGEKVTPFAGEVTITADVTRGV